MPARLFYAQSGGVTAVINATAAGVLTEAGRSQKIDRVLVGKNGILGALEENLYDTSRFSLEDAKRLADTPGGAFGSCRYKLKSLEEHQEQYERLIRVFKAHNIRYFLYNGGNDSQDTTLKVSQMAERMGYELQCIGIPKTIDNDLEGTDSCPGFGSVAKYVAISTLEASLDVRSMAETSTKVFIFEVMGRHAGWIAASAGLAGRRPSDPPHIILFPEVAFDEQRFLGAVQQSVRDYGYCTVVASEGLRRPDGSFYSSGSSHDAFGHAQLGGVGARLAALVQSALKLKVHTAVADYLQRSARHIASKQDVVHATQLGRAAVQRLIRGDSEVMVGIERTSDRPYTWGVRTVPLREVANREKVLPSQFIRPDGYGITPAARRYLLPLIQGEAYPPYRQGLPDYFTPKLKTVKKKC